MTNPLTITIVVDEIGALLATRDTETPISDETKNLLLDSVRKAREATYAIVPCLSKPEFQVVSPS